MRFRDDPDSAQCEAAPRECKLFSAIESIENRLGQLDGSIGRLESRLKLVLLPPKPEEKTKCDKVRPVASEALVLLSRIQDRIEMFD